MKKEHFPKGMLLDVGCRDRKEHNFVGVDWRGREGVDVVHDLEQFPYPFEDERCLTIKCAHVIEHIRPWLVFEFMNELWRLLKPGGQLAISAPYAGSPGWFQDPSHCTSVTEKTWQYFDPSSPSYEQYEPKPWRVEHSAYKPGGNIEAILKKLIPLDVRKSSDLATKAIGLGAMQKPFELTVFLETLSGKKLETVIEIGTDRGGVFYALGQKAEKDALLVSVDLPVGSFSSGSRDAETTPERLRIYKKREQRMEFVRRDSHDSKTKAEVVRILGGRKVDLLLIDGDHSYAGVKKDWKMYSPLVRKGGMIVFHDICHHEVFKDCEVEQFWKEVKRGRKFTEIIDPMDTTWGGIGVIVK